MERDKTGEIVFLPLSSHAFFVPLSSCIYLVLPWDSATIDAYRIHLPDKMQNFVGALYLAVIILSVFWTYVEINWPGAFVSGLIKFDNIRTQPIRYVVFGL